MQPTERNFEQNYRLKGTLVFTFALLLLFIRIISSALLSQIGQPPVVFSFGEREWVYRVFMNSGLIEFLTSNFIVAALFDSLLFFLPVVYLISRRQVFVWAFSLVSVIYFLLFNSITGHHYHGLVGLLVITIPFFTKNENRFNLLWDGARYYLLYIFASAALWKILRGSAFNPEQLVSILKAQRLDLLLQQPDSIRAAITRYLILHPTTAHGVLLVNVLLQLSFAVGFFTKRFDDVLLGLCILFVLANYFVMGIVSSELLILCITLLSFKRLKQIDNLTGRSGAEADMAVA